MLPQLSHEESLSSASGVYSQPTFVREVHLTGRGEVKAMLRNV